VMVWKMGSTDRSIVVIDEEFLLRRDGKSFLRISSPHPKGWLWISKFEMSDRTVRCLSCQPKNLKFKPEC
jgi:hypothetical protein